MTFTKSTVGIWYMQTDRYLRADLVQLMRGGCNQIMVFGHKGTGGQKGYIVSAMGICPSLTATCWKDPQLVVWKDDDG